MTPPIETLTTAPGPDDFSALAALLRDAIESGASVGFMLPVRADEMTAYWKSVFSEAAASQRLVLVAREARQIVGSVQLALATRPNSRHRAELQKLLVLRPHRGRGLGRALMAAAEVAAKGAQRSLLVLDTSASGQALGLYDRCGYTKVGVIPGFAQDPDGPFINTVIYFKQLPKS
jgi:acetyltransferase